MKRRIAAALAIGAIAATVVASPAEAANPTLHISYALPNSPGSDSGSNTSLNGEWVRIKNSSSTQSYTLTSWTVRDASSHVYTFGTYSLHPGESVTIHTGKGTNTHANRYWGRASYVWNNGGDTAYLKNSSSTTKDSCGWGSKADGATVTC
jgi:hypothetical protein